MALAGRDSHIPGPRIPGRRTVLSVTAVLGGAVVLVLPVARNWVALRANTSEFPILSPEAAQNELPFKVVIPASIPANGRLDGVRITHVVQIGVPPHAPTPQQIAAARSHQSVRNGYGLGVLTLNGLIVAQAVAESPAEKAGIRSQYPYQVVAVNGRPVRGQGGSGDRELVGQQEVVAAMHQPPPLTLTLRDSWGKEAMYAISAPGQYIYPDLPKDRPRRHHKQAALLLRIHGRSLAIVESEANDDEEPAQPAGAVGTRRVMVGNQEVWVGGPDEAPSLVWYRGGIHFWMNNNQGAVNLREALQIVRAMSR